MLAEAPVLTPYAEFSSPVACNYSKEAIEDLAVEIAGMVDFRPGGSIEDVVRGKLNGSIEDQDTNAWLAEESGSIEVRGFRDFTIFISLFTGYLRDRFTVAHELGHYFLHSRMGKTAIRATRFGTGRVEWEANWFAAAFLMPADVFKHCIDSDFSDDDLAAKFKVSPQAIEVRKKRFGL